MLETDETKNLMNKCKDDPNYNAIVVCSVNLLIVLIGLPVLFSNC